MFDQYSYKIKFRALIGVSILLACAAYKRSFGPLKEVVRQHSELSGKLAAMGSVAQDKGILEQDMSMLDRLIGKQDAQKEEVQQGIVAFVSKSGNHISFNNLQSIHEFHDEQYIVYTYQLDMTGQYNDLLKMLYDFEKHFDYSKVVSVHFFAEKKNNIAEKLHLNITFQNYENLN